MTGRAAAGRGLLFAAGLSLIMAAPAAAQAGPSSALAPQVAALMAGRQLEAFAIQDPEAPTRFVAALLIPDVQMLVVSAEYPNPAELQGHLARQQYREVYSALQQPVSAKTRFFLVDLGCDGLKPNGDAVDVLYEQGTMQTVFNGDWKKQGLSETGYADRLRKAEERYQRLLTVFRDRLKAADSSSPGTAR